MSLKLEQTPSSESSATDAYYLNNAIKTQKHLRELKFPNLDLESLRIQGYAKAFFARSKDYSSQ